MLLAPVANLAPETLSTAVAVVPEDAPEDAPEAASVAVPSAVLPTENVTVPAGATLPLAGVTVAVSCVVPAAAMVAGAAMMAVLLATGGPVTVTVMEAVELLKLPVGV
jgi:hypothetical protein